MGRWWEMTAMGLGVQLGMVGVTLYYFHFFPTYFLLSNWVGVPLAGVVLVLGLLTLALGGLPWVGGIVVFFLERGLLLFHTYLAWVVALPYAWLGPCILSAREVCLLYGLLFMLYYGFRYRKMKGLVGAFLCMTILTSCDKASTRATWKQRKMIFYHVPNMEVVGMVHGHSMTFLSDKWLLKEDYVYQRYIAPGVWGMRIREVERYLFEGDEARAPFFRRVGGVVCMVWKGERVVLAYGKRCVLPYSCKDVDMLVVGGVPVKQLIDWFARCSVGRLVIGMGYKREVRALIVEEAKKRGIQVYDISTQGALVV